VTLQGTTGSAIPNSGAITLVFCNEAEFSESLASDGATVIMTRGPLGCSVFHLGRRRNYSAVKAEPKDTTGAGDAFAGAFIYGHMKKWPIEKTAPFSNAVALRSIGYIGGREEAYPNIIDAGAGPMDFKKESETAQGAARKGGRILMDLYGKSMLKIGKKFTAGKMESFVTEADISSEKIMIDELSSAFPDYGLISEEAGEVKKDSEYRWIVDPLDGTRNFSCGNPLFCTIVALQKGSDIVSCAIYIPWTDDMFSATRGTGAFCNGEKICVSGRKSLDRFLTLTEGIANIPAQTRMMLFSHFGKNIRVYGSAGVDACLVASGKADAAVLYSLEVQDLAACSLLVKEAGGACSDLRGKKWLAGTASMVVSNGQIHDTLARITREIP
jgi:myo-inositol-1(or 4)-monophosphatase